MGYDYIFDRMKIAENRVEKLAEVLVQAKKVTDDLLLIYAPGFFNEQDVDETRERIKNAGGVVGYIADLKEVIYEALETQTDYFVAGRTEKDQESSRQEVDESIRPDFSI